MRYPLLFFYFLFYLLTRKSEDKRTIYGSVTVLRGTKHIVLQREAGFSYSTSVFFFFFFSPGTIREARGTGIPRRVPHDEGEVLVFG